MRPTWDRVETKYTEGRPGSGLAQEQKFSRNAVVSGFDAENVKARSGPLGSVGYTVPVHGERSRPLFFIY